MRCTDCWFLNNKITGGRKPQSCADLGELPQNEACGSFRARGQALNLPLAPTEIQLDPDKPIDFEYSKAFRQIYGEQLQIERDLHETTMAIQAEFFQDQAPAVLDRGFERYVQKLADLRLLHVLCGLFECGVYRDSIMAAEIEKQFGVKPPPEMVKQIGRSVKEVANAGVLRVSNAANRAKMGGATGSRSERKARSGPLPSVAEPQGTTEKSRRS
jgi:hypothetical protein